jgi:hypothetical protein
VVRFSYRMVPEVYQEFRAGMAAGEILDKVARGQATLDRITKSATHHKQDPPAGAGLSQNRKALRADL